MPTKKFNIKFESTTYKIRVGNSPVFIETLELLKNKLHELGTNQIILKKWTESETMFGEDMKIPHITMFGIMLPSKAGVTLKGPYSAGASVRFDYNKVLDGFTAEFVFKDDCLFMTGELLYKKTINPSDQFMQDVIESDVLVLEEVDVRVGRELLTFTKYGKDTDKEKSDSQNLKINGTDEFIKDRPLIKII
jgi:hypothetical protein